MGPATSRSPSDRTLRALQLTGAELERRLRCWEAAVPLDSTSVSMVRMEQELRLRLQLGSDTALRGQRGQIQERGHRRGKQLACAALSGLLHTAELVQGIEYCLEESDVDHFNQAARGSSHTGLHPRSRCC
jgi:hypothetical protein